MNYELIDVQQAKTTQRAISFPPKSLIKLTTLGAYNGDICLTVPGLGTAPTVINLSKGFMFEHPVARELQAEKLEEGTEFTMRAK